MCGPILLSEVWESSVRSLAPEAHFEAGNRQRRPVAAVAAAVVAVVLLLATFWAFWPISRNGFVLYDDPQYITANPRVAAGLSWEGLRWALTTTETSNWHPLTWLAHMADVRLFGLDPRAHHLSDLALHGANTLLLFLVLRGLTGSLWSGALAAALFALHPQRVESVAWAAEKKDLLAGLFWLLATGAYLAWVRRPGRVRAAVVAGLFALGLAAKPMLVTLPLALLVLDFWPLGRFTHLPGARGAWRLVREKLPLFALSFAVSWATYAIQRDSGAIKSLPLAARVANALVSSLRYLGQAVWPADLTPVYPHPGPVVPLVPAALAATALAGLGALLWRQRSSRPFLLAGGLWYLVTLLPVSGLVQLGWQGAADRYTYIPLIGPALALSWAAFHSRRHLPAGRWAAVWFVLPAILAVATREQTRHWRDSVALFSRAVAVTGDNFEAEFLLGKAFVGRGRLGEAIERYRRSAALAPGYVDVRESLGATLIAAGRPAEAREVFRELLAGHPENAVARRWLSLLGPDPPGSFTAPAAPPPAPPGPP